MLHTEKDISAGDVDEQEKSKGIFRAMKIIETKLIPTTAS